MWKFYESQIKQLWLQLNTAFLGTDLNKESLAMILLEKTGISFPVNFWKDKKGWENVSVKHLQVSYDHRSYECNLSNCA